MDAFSIEPLRFAFMLDRPYGTIAIELLFPETALQCVATGFVRAKPCYRRLTLRQSGTCRAEDRRQLLQRAFLVDGNDIHFAAHQGLIFSPTPDLLAEAEPVFRRAQH